MQTLYEDDLVESVVGLAAAGRIAGVSPAEVRGFHVARERCYTVGDSERRAESFAGVHAEWFARWGFRGRLEQAVDRFPELAAACAALVFRRSRGRHDEGAELYQDGDGCRRGVVALLPDRLASEPVLTGFLHHELAHLADMVSPVFGYSAASASGSHSVSRDRLVRERYRILWGVRIDGGLERRGLRGAAGLAHRRLEFERAFRFLPDSRRGVIFEGLWDGRIATHGELLHLASDPRDLEGRCEPVPGARCPLCGFAAFQWADAAGLRPHVRERVQAEFPAWQPGEPLCARCAEVYEALAGVEYPATVLTGNPRPAAR